MQTEMCKKSDEMRKRAFCLLVFLFRPFIHSSESSQGEGSQEAQEVNEENDACKEK
jgi:hypothetical protein